MELREKLRKLRTERGLSQQELADGIFVSRSAVAKWENGLGLPSDASREALAEFFGVPAADLRTEEPEAVILEKNRKLRRRTVSASTVTAILLLVLVCLNSWQSRQSARLRESMGQMDLRMEREFEGARVLLSGEFRERRIRRCWPGSWSSSRRRHSTVTASMVFPAGTPNGARCPRRWGSSTIRPSSPC